MQNWTNGNGEKYADFIAEQGTVTRFPGVSITQSYVLDGAGITYPSGDIHADPGFSLNLLQHEYGHYLQSQWYGENDFNSISFRSFINAAMSTPEEHNNYWTEKDANALSTLYFGTNSAIGRDASLPKELSDVFWKNFPINK